MSGHLSRVRNTNWFFCEALCAAKGAQFELVQRSWKGYYAMTENKLKQSQQPIYGLEAKYHYFGWQYSTTPEKEVYTTLPWQPE